MPAGRRRGGASRAALVFCTLALLLAFALGASPRPAWAKSYYVSDVHIEATVAKDGSMWVTERRTFDFSGSFSWVVQDLVLHGTQGISDITVKEDGKAYREASTGTGTYSYQNVNGRIEVQWRFAATDEKRTFELSYHVKGAVLVHLDAAELYWKFVGDEWEVTQHNIEVGLALPAGAAPGEVRAWGHGPLAGAVDIESPTRVVWQLGRLPKGTFLEGRVVFPTELVPHATRTSGQAALQQILDEEARLADRANWSRLMSTGMIVAGVLFLLGAILAAVLLQARHGREYRPEFEGDYYRELPGDYSPAELGCLWRFGPVGAGEMTATILDLARRGYLEIEVQTEEVRGLFGVTHERPQYLLKRVERGTRPLGAAYDPGMLRQHERMLLSFLFGQVALHVRGAGAADTVNFDDIKAYARSNPSAMQTFVKGFEGAVRSTDAAGSFFDKRTEQVRIWEMVAGVFAFLGGGGFTILGAPAAAVPLMAGGAILLVAAIGLRRRSQLGSTHLAMWRAFRRFLLHFSALDRAEVPSLTIWEHYLVFAVVLGVAKQVLEQLKIVYPQLAEAGPGVHPWIWMHVARGTLAPATMVGSLTDALHSSVATAVNYRPSSRGGFGGGFSGGGGRGGGGGGGRAG